jgi:hypothetical protein
METVDKKSKESAEWDLSKNLHRTLRRADQLGFHLHRAHTEVVASLRPEQAGLGLSRNLRQAEELTQLVEPNLAGHSCIELADQAVVHALVFGVFPILSVKWTKLSKAERCRRP